MHQSSNVDKEPSVRINRTSPWTDNFAAKTSPEGVIPVAIRPSNTGYKQPWLIVIPDYKAPDGFGFTMAVAYFKILEDHRMGYVRTWNAATISSGEAFIIF